MYVPQSGDGIYYIWQGHEAYLQSKAGIQESMHTRPWEELEDEVSDHTVRLSGCLFHKVELRKLYSCPMPIFRAQMRKSLSMA